MSQLHDLAKPFPARFVKTNPSGGGVYVAHPMYAQRLLLHLGGYSFELVEVIRGHVDAKPPNPNGTSAKAGSPALEDAIVGVVARLSVTVDGTPMVIEDVGDCEQPHNWDTDGKRMKDAMSDALKRCCARIGLGLHLYAKEPDEYVLAGLLKEREIAEEVSGAGGADVPTGGDGVPANDGAGIEGPASDLFCDACKADDCQHCWARTEPDGYACDCPHDDGRPM